MENTGCKEEMQCFLSSTDKFVCESLTASGQRGGQDQAGRAERLV